MRVKAEYKDSSFVVQFNDSRNFWTPRKHTIRWISNDSSAQIIHKLYIIMRMFG